MMFSVSTRKTSKTSDEITSLTPSAKPSGQLYTYADIRLKTYLEIAWSGDYSLLIIKGKPTLEEISDAWEKIIEENARRSGDNQYDNYSSMMRDYEELFAKQTIISIQLELLAVCAIDFDRLATMWDILKDVRLSGYNIETTNKELFCNSLNKAIRKASQQITTIERKRKELERMFPVKQSDEKPKISFEEIVGYLELALDRTISDGENLTLAKYNILRKGAEDRIKAQEKKGRGGKHGWQ